MDAGSALDEAAEAEAEAEAKAPLAPPTKMDILFVVGNEPFSSAEEQQLSLVVPDFLNGLLNPACVDSSGAPVPASMQPPPTGSCPQGTQRDFPVIYDAHIGLLSTSLGSFGADGCPDTTTTACPGGATNTSNNDHGHLVTRTDPCSSAVVPTYQGQGFLAWDPKAMLNPPGTSQLENSSGAALANAVSALVTGSGQLGCAFPSQNEAWYRFLVDPAPYQSIALNGQSAQSAGVDTVLLQQRSQFLRPDSLLLIVELSSKTDTSIRETGNYPLFAETTANGQPFHLPRARAECMANGPKDPCCASCGQPAPAGCPVDPQCTSSPQYSNTDENISLRAFGLSGGLVSQKARYGIEFFYPPSRYVTALTSPTLVDEEGGTVPNPIFAGGQRSASDVLYAAVTGVPWQLIARQSNGQPDLVSGVDDLDPAQVGGFKTYAELSEKDSKGNTFWDDIAGDPENYVPPLSPFMQESTSPRTGTDPITGVAVTQGGTKNALNGYDYAIPTPPGDIEYACIFPATQPIDCTLPGLECDCPGNSSVSKPICSPNPNDNGHLTLQTSFQAYPGVKQLAIAKGLGAEGIVASLCPKQLTDPSRPDFGYLPAVKAVVDRVKLALKPR